MQTNSKIDQLMSEGLDLHQSGRRAEAEAIYRRVLKLQPSHGAANHLLGVALLQGGKAQDAVTHLTRAVHVRGNDADYQANLGTALNSAGRPLEALAAFDRALALRPDFAAALNNRGLAFRALGRPADAIASYRAALAVLPEEAGFLRNLGNALTELGDWHGAEKAYRDALAARPGYASAVAGLCLALETLGRLDEAISTAAAHIAKDPGEPEYHRAFGHASWTAGKPEAAATGYRGVIAAKPDDAEAHRMLGLIVRRSEEDDEVKAVEALLARGDLSDDERAQFEFTLGRAYDDIGAFDRAFEHFSRGNALKRKLTPFDPKKAEAEFDRLRRLFESLSDARVPELAPPEGPVFIVGLPRSGKSTIEGMLARHPAFTGLGEQPLLGNLVSALRERRGLDGPGASLADVPESDFAQLGKAYGDAVSRLVPPGRRPIDTMPNNFLLVGFLRLALPGARIISLTRDPEEHAVSLFQKYFARGGNEYASDLGDIAAHLAGYRQLVDFWTQRFPGFILGMEFPLSEPKMRQLLAFLGASGDPASLLPFEPEPRLGPAASPGEGRLKPYLRWLQAPPDREI